MKFMGSRRSRILGAVVLVLLVAGATLTVVKHRAPSPTEALAASDSTAAGDSSGARAEAHGKKGKRDGKEKKEEPPVPVELAVASARDIPSYFNATGSLEAKSQVTLIAKAGGQVVRLAVEEGNFVKQGQVLLELDHRQEELLVEQTRVKAETAQRELERIQGLVEKGLGSDKDFEASREAAKVAQLEHQLAQVKLDNAIVRAPFSGQITVRKVELGQTVNVGTELLELADVSPLEVKLYLPEKVVSRLGIGQPVEMRSDVAPDAPLEGGVSRIAPSVDPATSTVKVTLEVKNPGDAARVGSFVRARITTDVVKNAVSVPKKALVPEAGVTYLFRAEADTVRKVPVTTGYADDDYIEITGGLSLGDTVVTVGQGGLRTGSKIQPLDPGAEKGSRAEGPRDGETVAELGN